MKFIVSQARGISWKGSKGPTRKYLIQLGFNFGATNGFKIYQLSVIIKVKPNDKATWASFHEISALETNKNYQNCFLLCNYSFRRRNNSQDKKSLSIAKSIGGWEKAEKHSKNNHVALDNLIHILQLMSTLEFNSISSDVVMNGRKKILRRWFMLREKLFVLATNKNISEPSIKAKCRL